MSTTVRLNKYIANNSSGLSRRKVDSMISAGQVKVNSLNASLGQVVKPGDIIEVLVNGKWSKINNSSSQTILIYKPIFRLVSTKGQNSKKTIYDDLPKSYSKYKPAGRLDYMSEGLLVMSSDGDLIQKLTHPKNQTTKEYLVSLDEILTVSEIRVLSKGVKLNDYITNPIIIKEVDENTINSYKFLKINETGKHWYIFQLSEGRNRQIRKMCQLVNKKVRRLIRIKHGKYQLSKELYQKKLLAV